MTKISDLLNPLVVKEIRQDLRLKTFTHFFIWPQLILGLFMLANLDGNPHDSEGVQAFSWLAVLLPLIFFLPRRAFQTFTREEQANSLELLLLTKLSAWKIVWGKWLALLLQSSLFVIAITPYFVAQYIVFGGDLRLNFEILFLVFVGSAALLAAGTAAGAGSRKTSSLIPGGLLIVALPVIIGIVANSMMFSRSYSSGLFSGTILTWREYLSLLTMIPMAILIALSIGVSLIAPPQVDNAPQQRGLIAAFVILGTLLLVTGLGSTKIVPALMCTVLTPIGIYLMHERIHPLTWSKREKFGAIAWLICSGWPGGVLVALLLLAFVVTIMTIFGPLTTGNAVFGMLSLSAGLLMPRAVLYVMSGGRTIVISVFQYFLIQAIIGVIQIVLFAAKAKTLASLFPFGASIMILGEAKRMPHELSITATCLGAVIVFIVISLELLRAIQCTEQQAKKYTLASQTAGA